MTTNMSTDSSEYGDSYDDVLIAAWGREAFDAYVAHEEAEYRAHYGECIDHADDCECAACFAADHADADDAIKF